MGKHKLLSVILLSYNSESRIKDVFHYYKDHLEKEKIDFEFIIMDDGSKDQSYEIGLQLEKEYSNVRAFKLSKNYTSPYSQFAGLKVCKGDCAMFVSDDYQRPVENLIQSYRKWEEGHKIVISSRISRNDGVLSDLFSNLYYKIMNKFSSVDFPKGGTDGFLADREIIDLINNHISPVNTTPVIEVLRLGFDPYIIPFHRPKSESKSRWTLSKKINLAKDTFFASTSFPIRFITYLGFLIFFLSLIAILALIYGKLFTANKLFGFTIPGWTTTLIVVVLFNGLTLFCLGVVAEYIFRIYEEVKGRPAYIIRNKEKDSGLNQDV